jgi:hypothetical protein
MVGSQEVFGHHADGITSPTQRPPLENYRYCPDHLELALFIERKIAGAGPLPYGF